MVGFVALTLPVLLVIVAYQFVYDALQERADDGIAPEMSVAQVVALAGEPLYATDGTRGVDPEYPRPERLRTPGCTKERWYQPRFTFLPSKWPYCFNDKDELVFKFHWVS